MWDFGGRRGCGRRGAFSQGAKPLLCFC